ncbi:helix-turn-helix domain-containing protein [Adlercreutzia shanghongiae]|uniref:helix-turn-helix domain-containing protein n=1 Tax=Adlercreutzia shanghongiae TaxID=3111773 RepID=UPI002DB88691|nr:LuxR C-terminal-related transcriptional regulator [Adlercreutzia sp. R25]
MPVEVLLFIWLVMFPLLGVRTGFLYICYLLPFQLLVIVLAFIGSKSFGGVTQKSIFLKLDVFLRVVGILGIVIVFEDVVTGLYYGLGNDVAGLVASGAIRSRNTGENIFQIIIAVYLIAVAGHFFVGKIAAKPIHDEGSTERLPEEVVDTYATSVGLSLREREILGFLLEEKSAQEISELLFISVGTVKSHTHNIYQKAGVGNRMQLLQKIKYL